MSFRWTTESKDWQISVPSYKSKKAVKYEDDNDFSWCPWNGPLREGTKELEIRGRIETIQTKPLLSSAKILRGILETWGDLLSLRIRWKITSLPWSEKLARCKIRVNWKILKQRQAMEYLMFKTLKIMIKHKRKILPHSVHIVSILENITFTVECFGTNNQFLI